MSTAAQLAANQSNAQLSTGPRTPEGKATAARNSLRHGLTSAELIIAPGEESEFNAFLESFTRDLRPEGALETVFFNDIVHAAWQKRRARFLEARVTEDTPEAFRDLDRLRRYHGYWDRLFHRAYRQLQTLQRERATAAPAPGPIPTVIDRTQAPRKSGLNPALLPRPRLASFDKAFPPHALPAALASFRKPAPEAVK
ncbi:MAG: hypothetical protein FJW40_27485 [Acidobacteria bacterium]|nr:hypothetical protein [Acidobacteriota bacterium]